MKSKNSHGVHAGSSSLLFIFLTLALISFAALSLSSAQADYRLTQKTAERTKAYYAACNEMQKSLEALDASLADCYAASSSSEAYFKQAGQQVSLSLPFTDMQTLKVSAEVLYPEAGQDGPYYCITSWQVITDDTLEYHDSYTGILPES